MEGSEEQLLLLMEGGVETPSTTLNYNTSTITRRLTTDDIILWQREEQEQESPLIIFIDNVREGETQAVDTSTTVDGTTFRLCFCCLRMWVQKGQYWAAPLLFGIVWLFVTDDDPVEGVWTAPPIDYGVDALHEKRVIALMRALVVNWIFLWIALWTLPINQNGDSGIRHKELAPSIGLLVASVIFWNSNMGYYLKVSCLFAWLAMVIYAKRALLVADGLALDWNAYGKMTKACLKGLETLNSMGQESSYLSCSRSLRMWVQKGQYGAAPVVFILLWLCDHKVDIITHGWWPCAESWKSRILAEVILANSMTLWINLWTLPIDEDRGVGFTDLLPNAGLLFSSLCFWYSGVEDWIDFLLGACILMWLASVIYAKKILCVVNSRKHCIILTLVSPFSIGLLIMAWKILLITTMLLGYYYGFFLCVRNGRVFNPLVTVLSRACPCLGIQDTKQIELDYSESLYEIEEEEEAAAERQITRLGRPPPSSSSRKDKPPLWLFSLVCIWCVGSLILNR